MVQAVAAEATITTTEPHSTILTIFVVRFSISEESDWIYLFIKKKHAGFLLHAKGKKIHNTRNKHAEDRKRQLTKEKLCSRDIQNKNWRVKKHKYIQKLNKTIYLAVINVSRVKNMFNFLNDFRLVEFLILVVLGDVVWILLADLVLSMDLEADIYRVEIMA